MRGFTLMSNLFEMACENSLDFDRLLSSISSTLESVELTYENFPENDEIVGNINFGVVEGNVIERLREAHDVLCTVEENKTLVRMWFVEERDWETLYEVPEGVFRRSMELVKGLIDRFESNPNVVDDRYDRYRKLVDALIEFRLGESS